MYTHYFGFREEPFSINPDPRFFYANPGHEETYASLLYGIRQRKGYISLIGEAGTGKTTLLRRVVDALEKNIRVAFYYYDTTLTFDELLDFVCSSFDLPVVKEGRKLEKIQALDHFLRERLAEGGTGVLIFDEAHHLANDVLENLRLLSNIELNNHKLLQIVLVGQPELEAKLDQPELRQLKQRIAISCRLGCLKPQSVGAFIQHRLQVAGCERTDLFTPEAVQSVAIHSEGIPRLINTICDNALSIAYNTSQSAVSEEIIEKVVQDLRLQKITQIEQTSKKKGLWFTREKPSSTPVPVDVQETAQVPANTSSIIRLDNEVWGRSLGTSSGNLPEIWVGEAPRMWSKPLPWIGVGTVAALLLLYFGSPVLFPKNELAITNPASVQLVEARSPSVQDVPPPVTQQTPASPTPIEQAAITPVAELTPTATRNTAAQPATNVPSSPQPAVTTAAPSAIPSPPPALPQATSEAVIAAASPASPSIPPIPSTTTTHSAPQPATVATKDSQNDATTQPQAPPTREEQGQAITVARGDTVSELVLKVYGNYSTLALDLIKEANPHIADLDRIFVGQQMLLPTLSRDTLLRKQQDGSYRLIVGAFQNTTSAEQTVQAARRRGYTAKVVKRRVSGTHVLYRVELEKISDLATADRAWDLVVGNNS
ncbi:MAG: AAA family ATPase [Candidatus Binatia bacterium]